MAIKSQRKRIMMRVIKGGLVPADNFGVEALRAKKLSVGQIVSVDVTVPRNPALWGLAHRLGTLVKENIESFEGMDSHKALKRLQREGMIECEEFSFFLKGHGMIPMMIPRSLAFDMMDDDEFSAVFDRLIEVVISNYWKSETPESIKLMLKEV
jgi:hypothetical protein